MQPVTQPVHFVDTHGLDWFDGDAGVSVPDVIDSSRANVHELRGVLWVRNTAARVGSLLIVPSVIVLGAVCVFLCCSCSTNWTPVASLRRVCLSAS